jgi:hypothetical protein
MMKSFDPCAFTLATGSTSSLLRLATETRIRPALTCMDRMNQPNSEQSESKSSTAQPPRRTLCGGIQLHLMQESHGLNRETIETHSLMFLT